MKWQFETPQTLQTGFQGVNRECLFGLFSCLATLPVTLLQVRPKCGQGVCQVVFADNGFTAEVRGPSRQGSAQVRLRCR